MKEFKKFIADVYNGIQQLLSYGLMPEDVHFANIRKDMLADAGAEFGVYPVK